MVSVTAPSGIHIIAAAADCLRPHHQRRRLPTLAHDATAVPTYRRMLPLLRPRAKEKAMTRWSRRATRNPRTSRTTLRIAAATEHVRAGPAGET